MKSSKFFKIMCAALLLIFLGTLGISYKGCGRDYSEGDRSGVIVKLSRTGLIWKSWEGEMRLGGHQNVTSGSWMFSIRDDSLVPSLQESMKTGRRVTVHYTQWWQKPGFGFQEALARKA